MLVDTHAHLNFRQFEDDLSETIARARDAGVTRIVNVGTNLASSRAAIDLADRTDGMSATAGFHPHDVENVGEESLEALDRLVSERRVVAVGESGLDFFRDYAPHDLQEKVFRFQIQLAVKMDLPIVVHSRGAEDRVLELLETEGEGRARGVLHCFGGTVEQAARAVELGFCLGFGGTVTYRNSDALDVALGVPESKRVLETDCPFLAPVPKRGKRNEPAFVRHVAVFLAERLSVPVEKLAETTTRNAVRLFGLGPA